MGAGYRDNSPEDAAGAAFIILGIGIILIGGALVAIAILIARHIG